MQGVEVIQSPPTAGSPHWGVHAVWVGGVVLLKQHFCWFEPCNTMPKWHSFQLLRVKLDRDIDGLPVWNMSIKDRPHPGSSGAEFIFGAYIPWLWNIEWVVCAFRNQSCAFNSTNFCSSDSSHTGASPPPLPPFLCNDIEVHEQPVFHPSFWKQKLCKLVLIEVSCCKGKVIEKLCQVRPNISCNNFWRW